MKYQNSIEKASTYAVATVEELYVAVKHDKSIRAINFGYQEQLNEFIAIGDTLNREGMIEYFHEMHLVSRFIKAGAQVYQALVEGDLKTEGEAIVWTYL